MLVFLSNVDITWFNRCLISITATDEYGRQLFTVTTKAEN